jgi:pimeloyl-ACP methyl ester carboxylesterase
MTVMAESGVVRAGVLDIAFERHGNANGWPVVLLHGFPYDIRGYDRVAAALADAGADVVVPYLRGYGATRFVSSDTMRSGQQAALAHDLLELIDALGLTAPIVAGYDWGGRAACLVGMLWPERVSGLVSVSGYNVQNIPASGQPAPPEDERRLWYQYYLHNERGRAGLAAYREDYTRLLWREWSPNWHFTESEFAATAPSFSNPDFVDVVVHSYRHRYGLVAGDPAYDQTEHAIEAQPVITVPTVIVDPTEETLASPDSRAEHETHFTNLVELHTVAAGHNPAQEQPADFAEAILRLHAQA